MIKSKRSEGNDQKQMIRSQQSEVRRSEVNKGSPRMSTSTSTMVQIKDNHYLPNPYFDERALTMTLLKLDHTSLQGKYSNGFCLKVNTNQATKQRWMIKQSSTTLNDSETARFCRRLLQRLFSFSLSINRSVELNKEYIQRQQDSIIIQSAKTLLKS